MAQMSANETAQVTVEDVLDTHEAARFWPVYRAAFGHLATRAAARQTLHREEYFEEMADPKVAKYVARADDGEAIGLTTLILSLSLVPWISPEYYAARYPEQAAREVLYYVGFSLTHPHRRSVTAFPAMVNAITARASREKAVLLWDVCAYNNDAFDFADGIGGHVKRTHGLTTEQLDSQTYYALAFP